MGGEEQRVFIGQGGKERGEREKEDERGEEIRRGGVQDEIRKS
jgi:hypothetical protein